MTLDATVSVPQLDLLEGSSSRSSGTTTATGQAVIATFECNAVGVFPVHLVTSAEAVPYTTTLTNIGAAIGTDLRRCHHHML